MCAEDSMLKLENTKIWYKSLQVKCAIYCNSLIYKYKSKDKIGVNMSITHDTDRLFIWG